MAAALFPDLEGHWLSVRDGDHRALTLYLRHYSGRKNGPSSLPTFCGPGEKIVLLTPAADALWVWRAERFRRDGQTGINCAIFRNESETRSSDLIREASEIAWRKWPGERLYTFVWDAKVKTSEQRGRATAGWCYRKAGWTVCGRNADGRLTILEILPPTTTRVPGPVEHRRHGEDAANLTQEVTPETQQPLEARGPRARTVPPTGTTQSPTGRTGGAESREPEQVPRPARPAATHEEAPTRAN